MNSKLKKNPNPNRKPTVLAVDDHDANLVALEAVLGSDYNLKFARSGKEAISILQANQNFDVILMDVQMPDMDGFQTAIMIKKIEAAREIPIIFITAVYKEEPFIKKGFEAGGIDYFSKPFDPDILRLKVGVYASFRQRSIILKEREIQIRETEELLRVGRRLSAVLENLPVGVVISDVDGRICQINEQVSKICNSAQPANPNSYGEMLGWWDANGKVIAKSGPLSKALREGQASHSEIIKLNCADGSQKSIVCSASPLLGLDKHIVGAVIVLQDVTESREIKTELENKITRFVSASVELDEVVQQ